MEFTTETLSARAAPSDAPASPRRLRMAGQSLTMSRMPTRREREMLASMASGSQSAAEMLRMQEIRSEVNAFVVRPDDVDQFEASKMSISDSQRQTMETNVGAYFDRLHEIGGAGSGFSPRKAHAAMVPDELKANAMVCHSPRRVGRIFDEGGYYESKQKPLTNLLDPNLGIIASFKQFLAERKWNVPKMLEDL